MIHQHAAAVVLGALLVGGAAGYFAARYLIAERFRRILRKVEATETLGKLLDAAQKQSCASVYHDADRALRQMDNFIYAVPNVPTPFVGSGPRPGRSHNAEINSFQFRNTSEPRMPKPGETYRVFLTGGSTAFGAAAPAQDATPGAYLERDLNSERGLPQRVEVFTFANPAWASTHERIAIENRLSELEPDMVISLSGNNDAHWAIMGRNVLWFRTYAEEHFWRLLGEALRVSGAPPMADVTEKFLPAAADVVAERLSKNARLSARALRDAGAAYVFALQPTITVSTKPLSAREARIRGSEESVDVRRFRDYYAAMRSRLRRLSPDQLFFVDLADVFAPLTADDEIFLDSYHFGDRGDEIVAHALADALQPIIAGTERSQKSV